MKGAALAGDTVARQAVIDRTARAVMAVMMIFTGMPVLVGGVINRRVRGSDSNAGAPPAWQPFACRRCERRYSVDRGLSTSEHR